MRTRSVPVLLAAVAAAGLAPFASAAGVSDVPLRERVGYSDLDLANGAAVRAFYERLNVAAAHVCAPYSAPDPRTYRRCVTQVLSSAVIQIRSPALTRYAGTQLSVTPETVLRLAGGP